MSKEPVVWTAAIALVIEAVLPFLVLIGVLDWSAEQISGAMIVVAAIVTAIGSVFARSKVTPV